MFFKLNKILLIISLLLINLSSLYIVNLNHFINNLNKYSIYRQPKYILLFDYIYSPVCEDLNAFIIFEYFLKNNITDAYYIINDKSELYKRLLKHNKTKNIIPFKISSFNKQLFPFILNSKIIVQSYALYAFQKITSSVKYLKFLYICHAVNYFKISIIQEQLSFLDKNKQNIILTSPYEYRLYKKLNLYNEKSMYKGGLPRYDRFLYTQKSSFENDCILISFTYRSYGKSTYENSLFKKNINNLLADPSLITFLEKKNIDLIFIQHHHDEIRKRDININYTPNIKFLNQQNLEHYIVQCSLYITDFSSISFDFMFQHKPVLFYHLDINDKIEFKEKAFMKIDYNNSIYFNNIFVEQNSLVNKIKYYVNRNFTLEKGLDEKYNTLFYNKKNITMKIIEIINKIIEED